MHPNRSKLILALTALFILLLLSFVIALLITPKDTTQPTQPTASAPTPTAEVSITKDGFVPAALSVKKGTKIIWTNSDGATHQLQANPHPTGKSLPGLKSEILNNKQTYSYTANKAGSFGYHDHLSPTMNGSLDVKE